MGTTSKYQGFGSGTVSDAGTVDGVSLDTDISVLLATALVDLNESGIVGSSPVTEWTNSGTGGSPYDLDVIVGTGANLTAVTVLGHTAIRSVGSAGLEATSGQLISQPMTIFAVATFTDASPSTFQVMFSSRSSADDKVEIVTNSVDSDKFVATAGTGLTISSAYDNDPHLFSFQIKTAADDIFKASGLATQTSDGGSNNWDYGTLFVSPSEGSTAKLDFNQLLVFDTELSDDDFTIVENYLLDKYGL